MVAGSHLVSLFSHCIGPANAVETMASKTTIREFIVEILLVVDLVVELEAGQVKNVNDRCIPGQTSLKALV
jgi:hypothetical protein